MGRPSRRAAIAGVAVVATTAIVIAAVAFAPWRLFIDTEVRDADPFVTAAAEPTTPVPPPSTAAPSPAPTTRAAPPTTAVAPTTTPTTAPPASTAAPASTAPPPSIRVGTFRSIAHQTSGTVRVGPTPDGRQVVYLEDLATDNGPDVRVFLSPHPPEGDDSIYGTDELELGPLKGNIGNQTYEVPDGIDLSRYQSVVLWCERFSVGFGVAGLVPA